MSTSQRGSQILRLGGLVLGLIIASVLVGKLYQGAEQFVPFWDVSRSYMLYGQVHDAFDGGILEGLLWLRSNIIEHEYNATFSLLLLPFGLLWELNRDDVVLLTLAIYLPLYAVTYYYFLHSILSLMGQAKPNIPAYLGGLLIPPLWFATLLGFETIAALPLLTLGLTALVKANSQGSTRGYRCRCFVWAGLFFALAAIVRRPMVLIVIGSIGGSALNAVLAACRSRAVGVQGITSHWLGLLLVMFSALITCILIAPGFLRRVLFGQHRNLYVAYELAPWTVIKTFVDACGLTMLVVVACGFLFWELLHRDHQTKLPVTQIWLTLILILGAWILGLRYPLYLDKGLLFAPFLGLGLSLSLTYVRRSFRRSSIMLLLLALLAFNQIVSLGVLGHSLDTRAKWFAKPHPPTFRTDFPQLKTLVEILRDHTIRGSQAEPINVLASSVTINPDLLHNADKLFAPDQTPRLQFVSTPSIDRKHNLPTYLLFSEWVLLANPLQIHLRPWVHKTLSFAFNELTGDTPTSKAYRPIGTSINLIDPYNHSIAVQLYHRIKPTTPSEGLEFIRRAQEWIAAAPVYPCLWMAQNAPYIFTVSRRRTENETYDLRVHPDKPGKPPADAFLLEPMSGSVTMSGAVRILDSRCQGLTARVGFKPTASLNDTWASTAVDLQVVGRQQVKFEVTEILQAPSIPSLEVEAAGTTAHYCTTAVTVTLKR